MIKDWYLWVNIPFPLFVIIGIIIYKLAKDNFIGGIITLFIFEMVLRDTFNIKIITELSNKKIWYEFIFVIVFFVISIININKTKTKKYKASLLQGAFIVIIFVELVYGISQYKLAALYDSLGITVSVSFLFYILSFNLDVEDIEKAFKSLTRFVILLLILAVIKYFFLLYLPSKYFMQYIDLRVVDRNGVMLWVLILTYFLLNIVMKKNNFKRDYFFAIILSIFIILSTLRQAWVVSILVVFILFFLFPKRFLIKGFVSFLFVLIVYFSLMGLSPKYKNLFEIASESFTSTIIPTSSGYTLSENSTFYFREKISEKYIENMTTISFIFGKGFGDRPYIDYIEGQSTIGLHNQYMHFLYFTGIFGLALFVMINIKIIGSFFKYRRYIFYENKSRVIGGTLLIAMLYYIPANYSNTFDYIYPMVFAFASIYLIRIKKDLLNEG